MLFNSYEFILVFLPLCLFGFMLTGRFFKPVIALVWLLSCSIFFYGWWNPSYLVLIGLSIIANFGLGLVLGTTNTEQKGFRKAILITGILGNLGAIGYYKYANFFLQTSNTVFGTGYEIEAILLPLAISFYTFQQIAYLVDCYTNPKACEKSILHYSLFIAFFPQLIAGPIVHHSQIMPQIRDRSFFKLKADNIALGWSYFLIGLFKKVVLADSFATIATPIFGAADSGVEQSFLVAWIGAMAYTLQLYFDFSGYSDMAIGLAKMFGINLPLNFNSPYKATSISDFWRRWHMTLSQFLRDYIYIPLGGNQKGSVRRYSNLMTTMLIGGLWHGAGWNFILWGGLHGIYLVINHGWTKFRVALGWDRPSNVGRFFSIALTFLSVVVAWMFFRAETFDGALIMLQGMFGFTQLVLPQSYMALAESIPAASQALSLVGAKAGVLNLGDTFTLYQCIALIAVGLAIVFYTPNTREIVHGIEKMTSDKESVIVKRWYNWSPSPAWAVNSAVLATISLSLMSGHSEFLYFQF